jgi:hypothetical protein
MWRRLFLRVHPDHGGSADLFVWSKRLYEHASGDRIEETPRETRRDPPEHKKTGDRVDYSGAERFDSFEDLTRHAVAMADEEPPVYGDLLTLLRDCYPSVPTNHVLRRSEWQGATFKQLAYIGHLANPTPRRSYTPILRRTNNRQADAKPGGAGGRARGGRGVASYGPL